MMDRPPRWRRRALIALGTLAGLTIALLGGLRLYLSPSRSVVLLRDGISRALDMPVTLDSGHIALFGESTLTGLAILDEGGQQPMLWTERASARISALGIAAGKQLPERIRLEGAHLTLRFGKDGGLLSRLPSSTGVGKFPAIEATGAKLTLLQDGREPFTLEGLTLSTDGETITGTAVDPAWGTFHVAGNLKTQPLELALTLKQDRAKVTPTLLRSIPFITPTVWDVISAEGTSAPLSISLVFGASAPRVRYEVEFAGVGMALAQSDRPAFRVEQASGRITGNEMGFRLAGKLHDRAWGTWNAEVSLNNAAGDLRVFLKGPPTVVDPKQLATLPYVPLVVWREVELTGTTPGEVTVRCSTRDGKVNYRVVVEPRDTRVTVPIIGLTATGAGGKVTVEDGIVTLEKVSGVAAGGRVDTSATLDFTKDDTAMRFALAVKGLSIASLPAKWELPKGMGGEITGEADLNMTVRAGKLTRTTGTGKGRIDKATVAGFPVKDVIELNLHADDKGLRFRPRVPPLGPLLFGQIVILAGPPPTLPSPSSLAGRAASGVAWMARKAVNSAGRLLNGISNAERATRPGEADSYLDADFSLDDVDIQELGRRVSMPLPGGFAGKVSVRVRAGIPINNARDARAYRLIGTATSKRLELAGLTLENVSARVKYENGIARVEGLTARIGKGRVTIEGRAAVSPPGDMSLSCQFHDVPVSALRRELGGTIRGTLDLAVPWRRAGDVAAWRGIGRLEAQELSAPGFAAREVSADVVVARGTLLAANIRADAFGSILTGEAGLNLTAPYRYTGSLQATRLDLARLTKLPLGKIAPSARIEGTLERGRVAYWAEATLMGGKATIEGKYPPPPLGSVGQAHGRIRLERIRLRRVLAALGQENLGLSGVGSLDLPFRHDGPGGVPVGTGRFVVRDLRHGDTELSDSIRGDMRLQPAGVYLRDVSGTIAGGSLRLQARIRVDDPSRGWFDLSLLGSESSRLIAVVGGGEGQLKGPLDLRLRGTLGSEWQGGGSATLARGRVLGVEVADWAVPLDFSFAPGTGRGDLRLRESAAQVGAGRARARFEIAWGERIRVEGTVRLIDAATRSLAGLVGDVSAYARGRVTGRIDIGGSEVRSASDLTADVSLTMSETQAMQLPVLRQIAPYLGPGQSATVFQKGTLKGRLARGIFRIRELTLESAVAQLFIDGSLTLQGRLDLNVVARTTFLGPVNPVLLRLVLRQVPPVGPVPVGLVVRATELLADRVVHLKVSGTTRSPVVRVEPLRILSDEAVRFLLTRLLVP